MIFIFFWKSDFSKKYFGKENFRNRKFPNIFIFFVEKNILCRDFQKCFSPRKKNFFEKSFFFGRSGGATLPRFKIWRQSEKIWPLSAQHRYVKELTQNVPGVFEPQRIQSHANKDPPRNSDSRANIFRIRVFLKGKYHLKWYLQIGIFHVKKDRKIYEVIRTTSQRVFILNCAVVPTFW